MSEDTYPDRVRRLFHMMDVRTSLVSDEAAVLAHKEVCARARPGHGLPPIDPEVLAWKTKVASAIVHPDTHQPVWLPLRLSSIIPMNCLLDLGMVSARTPMAIVAAQFANQSYNCAHYYANRNATNTDTPLVQAVAYVAATTSAVGTALFIDRAAAGAAPKFAPAMRLLGPLGAVAAADVLNLATMRHSELIEGVAVHDEDGNVLGKSKIAGLLAVSGCIFGRITAAIPILIIPPLLLSALDRSPRVRLPSGELRPLYKWGRMPILLSMLVVAIQFSVPVTFGIFRQRAEIPVTWAEAEFSGRLRADGSPVCTLQYNKGL